MHQGDLVWSSTWCDVEAQTMWLVMGLFGQRVLSMELEA